MWMPFVSQGLLGNFCLRVKRFKGAWSSIIGRNWLIVIAGKTIACFCLNLE